MSDDAFNPYAPPRLDEQGEFAPLAANDPLFDLGPRRVIVLLLLSVCTLGLYVNYWVHRQACAINEKLDRNHVSISLVAMFWITSVASLLWIVPEIVTDDDPTVVGFGELLSRADMILTIFMAFVIRGGLNSLVRVGQDHPAWFNGLWTLIFGIFYLQWKINRTLEACQLSAQRTGEDPVTSFYATPDTNADCEDALAAAARLDKLGQWDAAISLYQNASQKWPEQRDYVAACIADIKARQAMR